MVVTAPKDSQVNEVAATVPLPPSPTSSTADFSTDVTAPEHQEPSQNSQALSYQQQSHVHNLIDALLAAATALRESLPKGGALPNANVDVEKQGEAIVGAVNNGVGSTHNTAPVQWNFSHITAADAEEVKRLLQTPVASSVELEAEDDVAIEAFAN
ncbi:MAG: hypothetical protein Q9187_004928, partial [Circinaria calcarea]